MGYNYTRFSNTLKHTKLRWVNPLKGRGVNWLHFAIQVKPILLISDIRALNTVKCNCLTPLQFKGLTETHNIHKFSQLHSWITAECQFKNKQMNVRIAYILWADCWQWQRTWWYTCQARQPCKVNSKTTRTIRIYHTHKRHNKYS